MTDTVFNVTERRTSASDAQAKARLRQAVTAWLANQLRKGAPL